MPDDLTVVESKPLPDLSVVSSQPLPGPSLLDKANEYAGKALSAAGLPTSIENVPDWFKHLTGQAKDSEPFWEPIRKAIANPTQENLVAAVPFIGPSSVAMSKDVQAGNYGGAAATLAGTVAGPLAGGQVKPGMAAAKQGLADINQVANNVVDRTAPHSLVASAIKEVLPQPAPTPNFYGGAYSDFYGESPKEWPLTKAPTMTGDAAAAYRAGRKGVSLQEMAAQQAAKEGTGVNVVPEPRGNFTGEVPGYMASVPRGTLEDLALAGKPGAAVQLQQLGKPIIYSSRGGDISNVKSRVSLSDMAPGKADYAYRVRSIGEEGVPADQRSPAHATTTRADAESLLPGRESVVGQPQEMVRYDLSKLKEGVDYIRVPRPGQPDWIRQLRPLPESAVRKVTVQ